MSKATFLSVSIICLFLRHGNTAIRNYALNGTFVFLLSPPVDNVFEAIKQSGLDSEGRGTSSCDVSHRLFLSHKRCSDPSEQVPRERAADHRGTFTHLQLQWEELKACPLRMRAAQQKGHTHIHIPAQRQTVIAILHMHAHRQKDYMKECFTAPCVSTDLWAGSKVKPYFLVWKTL